MAKGRKPQGINLDNLMEYLTNLVGESKMPTNAVGAQANTLKRAFPQALNEINRGVIDFASPLTVDELTRLRDAGPDKGHAASLALFAALSKTPQVLRGAKTAYRAAKTAYRDNKSLFKDKQAPTGSRTQPKRTATASMSGTINDPMAQYAAYLAATRR
jgi:hypothetical protein